MLGGRGAAQTTCRACRLRCAVIEEAMRLYPPAYIIGREASATIDIGGHRAPTAARS